MLYLWGHFIVGAQYSQKLGPLDYYMLWKATTIILKRCMIVCKIKQLSSIFQFRTPQVNVEKALFLNITLL